MLTKRTARASTSTKGGSQKKQKLASKTVPKVEDSDTGEAPEEEVAQSEEEDPTPVKSEIEDSEGNGEA